LFVAIDLFDEPSTYGRVGNQLLSGTVLDALEAPQGEKHAEAADVQRALAGLRDLSWESVESVGEGDEYRAESPAGDHAAALVFHGTVIHASMVCGA
jgi:hypothetical protein